MFFSYETANGIQRQETGYIRNKGDKKHEVVVQQGTFSYRDEHGHPITVNYIADERGFQPQGFHLPTPPPVPEEIQKALDDVTEEEEENEPVQQSHEQHYQHEQQQYESY